MWLKACTTQNGLKLLSTLTGQDDEICPQPDIRSPLTIWKAPEVLQPARELTFIIVCGCAWHMPCSICHMMDDLDLRIIGLKTAVYNLNTS